MKYIFQIHTQEPEMFDTAKERMDTFIDIWFAPEYRQGVRELYDANGHTEAVQAMIDDPEMRADDDELLSVVFTERADLPGHTPGPWAISKHATPPHCPQFGIYSKRSTSHSPPSNASNLPTRPTSTAQKARRTYAAPQSPKQLYDQH